MDIITGLAEDMCMGTQNWNVRGYAETREVWVDDHILTVENSRMLKQHAHSFLWGDVTAWTDQLALAIVLRILGDEEQALACYHDFKQDFLVPLNPLQDFQLTIPIDWFVGSVLSVKDKRAVVTAGTTNALVQLEKQRATLLSIHHKAGIEHSFDKTMESAGALLNELVLRKVNIEHEIEEVLTKMLLQVAILMESPLIDTHRINHLMSLHLSKLQAKVANSEYARQAAHLD